MADALVTGGSGFVAKHCIAELLRRDFDVRATLRIRVARLLAEALPDIKPKVPRFQLPDFGFPRRVSNAKPCDVLGQSFRSSEEAVTSAAESLRALRVI